MTPQKWGVIFVLQMCKNLLIRFAVKRSKDNHIKALEARISLLERFISLPQVKPLWEQFQALIGRKKPQKDHER